MPLFAINAYESKYGGLHGMNKKIVADLNNMAEAESYGTEMSYDVMDSYSCISDEMYEEAAEEYEEGSEEFDAYLDELRNEATEYEIFQLRADCPLPMEQLNDMAYNDFEGLVEIWAIKEENE